MLQNKQKQNKNIQNMQINIVSNYLKIKYK